jgi:hypothetical protein
VLHLRSAVYSTERIEMVTREEILFKVQKMPEQYLDELYQIIKDFESRSLPELSDQDVMAKLREIKISASPDFSTKADLYDTDCDSHAR